MLAPFKHLLEESYAFIGVFERVRQMLNALAIQNCFQDENGAESNAGVAIGATATQVQHTATAVYRVGGIWKTKAAAEGWTTAVIAAGAPTVVPVSTVQKYLVCLAGDQTTYSVIECVAAATAAGVALKTNFDVAGVVVACIGTVQVTTDSTHTFIPGTTAFNAAGITSVFQGGFDTALAVAGRVLRLQGDF